MKKYQKLSLLLLLPLILTGCRETSSTEEPTSSTTSEDQTSTDDSSSSSEEIPIEDRYDIEEVELPTFVDRYKINIKENENKRVEFMDREQGFYVGADNEFRFFPKMFAYEGNREVRLESYPTVSILEQKVVGEYTTLAGSQLDTIVTIDNENAKYQFSEEAIGKEFRLTVRPYGDRYATDEDLKVSFEFKVSAGFNVYTQEDLHHYDNMNAQWGDYRTAKGLVQKDINGIILQNDIKITAEYFPSSFFYTESDVGTGPEATIRPDDADYDRVIGSIRDFTSFYSRSFKGDEHFVFNGNYFNIDFSTMPYVVREGSGGRIDAQPGSVVSHATLLTAGAAEAIGEGEEVNHQFTLKNVSIKGNANRTEEGEKSGGLIFNKMWKTNAHVYNNIASQAFTFYFAEHNTKTMLIEKTRAYDSYSSMLYSWGGPDLEIKDSEMIGAGGPIIIADHVSPGDEGDEGYPSNTKVTNSRLESFVMGEENWFVLVGATAAAGQLQTLGTDLLPNYGQNGILVQRNVEGEPIYDFNLIAVLKSSAAQGPTSDRIRGTFKIDEGVGLDFEGPFLSTSIAHQIPLAAPRFESSNGDQGIFDGEKLIDLYGQPVIPYAYTQQNHFTGEYLNLYLNTGGNGFMGIVFELIED